MELIIGGTAQGKLEFAKNKFNLSEDAISTKLESGKKVIYNLQNIVFELLKNEKDAKEIILNFADENENIVFVCDEVGSGLVPMEQFERLYRDTVGKICCELAVRAEHVTRVFCGIGKELK